MSKHADFTNIKTLPTWQRRTIIGIIVVLAGSFTISGAMIALVGGTPSENRFGEISGELVTRREFLNLRLILFRLVRRPNRDLVLPTVDFFDRMRREIRSDTIPIAYATRYGATHPGVAPQDALEKTIGQATWAMLILAELARRQGFEVKSQEAAAVARELVTQEPAPSSADEAKQQAREQQYRSELATTWNQMTAKDLEALVQKLLAVKAFVEQDTERLTVSYGEASESFGAYRQLLSLDWLRISPRAPKVAARAAEALADARALAAARRLGLSSLGLEAGTLAPDPLRAYYEENIAEYTKPRYRLAVLVANFQRLQDVIPLRMEFRQQFYDHYKDPLFMREETEVAARIAAERQTLEDAHADAEGWAPENGWAAWERDRHAALRFRPLDEVDREVQQSLRYAGTPSYAALVFAEIRRRIDERIAQNRTALGFERQRRQTAREVAQAFAELFVTRAGQVGIPTALERLEAAVAPELTNLENRLRLTVDRPAGTLRETIDRRNFLEGVTTVANRLLAGAFAQFARDVQLGLDPLVLEQNRIAAWEREQLTLRRDRERAPDAGDDADASSDDEAHRLDLIDRRLAGVKARLAFFRPFRQAMLGLRDAWQTRLNTLRLWGAAGTGPLDAAQVELELADFSRDLRRIVSDAATRAKVEATADTAREQDREAQAEARVFEADFEARVNNVGDQIDVRALAREFGLDVFEIDLPLTARARTIRGAFGALIPPVIASYGITLEDLAEHEEVQRLAPFLPDATEWKLKDPRPTGSNLAGVLEKLTPGAFSPPLGVENQARYLVLVRESRTPVAPTFAEVEARVRADYLKDNAADTARDLAERVRSTLAERAAALRVLGPEALAGELRANLPDDAARAALVAPLADGNPQAAVAARAALLSRAMVQVAEAYGLTTGTAVDVRLGDDVPGVFGEEGDDDLLKVAFTLSPGVEVSTVQKEELAEPDEPEESFTAYIILRTRATRAATDADLRASERVFEATTLDRRRGALRAQATAATANAETILDLGRLIDRARQQGIEVTIAKLDAR